MMIPKQKALSRRTVLRGAGVALGLPWLEAMIPSARAAAASAKSPVRMAVLYMANGVNTSQWTPEGQGRDFRLSPTLQPLAGPEGPTAGGQQSLERGGEHRRRTLHERVEPAHVHHDHQDTGRGHQHPRTVDGSGGGAEGGRRDSAAFAGVGDRTRIDGRGRERRVHASVRMPHCVERSDDSAGAGDEPAIGIRAPVPGGGSGGEFGQAGHAAARPRAATVEEDAHATRRERSGARSMSTCRSYDRSKREWSGPAIRSAPGSRWCRWTSAPEPVESPATHQEHVRLMLDLIALAFQSDTTRISTFMFGNAVSGVNFRFLEGVTDSHHEISHHSNNPEKLRQYAVINRWHVDQYGYLLRKLRDMKEGERSVLDNSMIMFASALERRQQARSAPAADRARGTRRRAYRVRPAPGIYRGFAGGQSVCIDARRFWNAGRALRGQHGTACRSPGLTPRHRAAVYLPYSLWKESGRHEDCQFSMHRFLWLACAIAGIAPSTCP